MNSLKERMLAEIEKIAIIDTHEHIMSESDRKEYAVDFSYLFAHYNSSDLISAGMSPGLLESVRFPLRRFREKLNRLFRSGMSLVDPENESMSLEQRWEALEPYWEAIRFTAYGRWTLHALKDLFGVEDLNRDSYRQLSEAVADSRKPGWYRHVLKEKANISRSIIDLGTTEVDREFFSPVIRMDHFIAVADRADLDYLEKESDMSIHSLADLEHALRESLAKHVSNGAVGLKSGLAYCRTLKYEKVTHHEAEVVFNQIFSHLGEGPSWSEAKPLQDYMMHRVIRAAIDAGLPIQIHTGLQEGNENRIINSNPTQLIDLIIEYREAKFDLFHGGYPFIHEWVSLAKNFANVYPDMCWMYIISPTVSGRLIHELIETVPANKILGFGGDSLHVEGAYAHSRLARQVISNALVEKVESAYFSEEEAIKLAERILKDNAAALYNLC